MRTEVIQMTFPGEGDMALILAFDGAADGEHSAVLGTVLVRRTGGAIAEFSRLYVREGQRRKGVGRALIDAATTVGRRAGCIALSGSVHPTNKAARIFYGRVGFAMAFQFADGDLLLTRRIAPLGVAQAEAGVEACEVCLGKFTDENPSVMTTANQVICRTCDDRFHRMFPGSTEVRA